MTSNFDRADKPASDMARFSTALPGQGLPYGDTHAVASGEVMGPGTGDDPSHRAEQQANLLRPVAQLVEAILKRKASNRCFLVHILFL